ncbi:MAG: F0F1 ATP synthase subunit A [Verrucomicrobiales bacterium]|nr:F0F1 ATP synthase subunit A [Verrucomicrobiales bacterium]
MFGKHNWRTWMMILLSLAGSGLALAAGAEAAPGGHAEAHEGLTQHAPVLFERLGFQVTNSMLVTWVVAALLILLSQTATRNIQMVPRGLQNFWEWVVESLHGFLEGIIGPDLVKKTFWFFATVFIFIMSANYFGLLPGVGSIGWGASEGHGLTLHHVSEPLFRGANADLNMTLAMALVFFACWVVWALQANGPGGFLHHIFGAKGESAGFMKVLMIGIFLFAGVLEVVSILFRPVSLSFRLYGNIFAGENMLETMALISPWFGWLCALPFYFLELMVGFVQALVFTLLTAVFVLTICQHDEDHGHAGAASGGH